MVIETVPDRIRRIKGEINNLLLTTKDKALLVEGPTDELFYLDKASKAKNYKIFHCNGSSNLEDLIQQFHNHGSQQIKAIRDADFTRILNRPPVAGVFLTDHYDIISDAFFIGEAFKIFAELRFSKTKLKTILKGSSLEDMTLEYCSALGLIRLLIKRGDFSCDLKDESFTSKSINGWQFDAESFCRITLKRSNMPAKDVEAAVKAFLFEWNGRNFKKIDLCRGHDISEFLEKIYIKCRKSLPSSKSTSNKSERNRRVNQAGSTKVVASDIEAIIISSYSSESFLSTNLGIDFRTFLQI